MSSPRHRHFLAFPLLAILVAGPFLPSGKPELTGDLISRSPEGETVFSLTSGVHGTIAAGSHFTVDDHAMQVRDGTVLIGGEGPVDLDIGSYSLRAIGGIYHASLQNGSLTVAAVTTPVLIRSGTRFMVVPPRQQWKGTEEDLAVSHADPFAWMAARHPAPVPPSFIRNAVQALEQFERSGAGYDPPDSLSQDDGQWLLGSLHPSLHASFWIAPEREHAQEAALLRCLLFPQADRLTEGFHALVWERWMIDCTAIIRKTGGDLLDAFLLELTPLAAVLEQEGYPERAEHVRSFLLALADGTDSSFAAQARDLLHPIHAVYIPPEDEGVMETILPATALDPLEAERRTHEALHAVQALYTVQTIVRASEESHRVEVENVAFASPQGDRLFTFTYDADSGIVSRVQEGERTYPLPLPLRDFVTWVRSGTP